MNAQLICTFVRFEVIHWNNQHHTNCDRALTGKQREDGGHCSSVHALQQDICWVICLTFTSSTDAFMNGVQESSYLCSILITCCLCPQSRPGSHHPGHEEVLWRQSLLFSAAFSEQVRGHHFPLSHRSDVTSALLSSTSSFSPTYFLRYIYYFSGLLSGTIKMNSSPMFLHQILIPSLPNFQTGGGQLDTI